MSFHEVRFPIYISQGSVGGPEWKTLINKLASGHEKRNVEWTYALHRFNVAYGIREPEDLQTVYEFFLLRRGRGYGFRFKDWLDYQAVGQVIGTGDDETLAFQLVKIYSDAAGNYSRKITKPVSGTVHIYFGETEQTTGWTVSTTTGIVTFAAAPAEGVIITADFEFDVPVRFDADHLPVTLAETQGTIIDVVEIRI